MKANDVILNFRNQIFDHSEFTVANIFFFGDKGKTESDIIAVTKTGYLVEYEVKTSRADFLADRRKTKWAFYKFNYNKAPKYFYYILPKGVAKPEELPDFAGLIEYQTFQDKITFVTEKKPVQLNRLKATEEEKYTLLKKIYYKSLGDVFNPEYHKILV